ncbi:OmpA family protein [Pseudoalteromonas sp. BZB3]|uniref:OmpA family protein n=1 Tax=Pseudoalteromonas sp. BZB3 TaxID=3136670 RepID=UPI0032C40B38
MTKLPSLSPIMLGLVLGLPAYVQAEEAQPVLPKAGVAKNTEQVLVQKHFVFHGLAAPTPKTVQEDYTEQSDHKAEFVEESAIRFVSGKHYLTGSTRREMNRIVDFLRGKKQLRIHFIGHADSQRLSPRAKKIYKTNQGLSEHRAKIVSEFFRQQLELDPSVLTTEGRSNHEPVADNGTLEGMARNRRVEVIAVYIKEKTKTREVMGAMPSRELVCQGALANAAPMMITLDGEAFSDQDSSNNADEQRCADVALANMQLQLKYDPINLIPRLSVQHALTKSGNTLMMHLRGYSNYDAFIDYAEVQIMAPDGRSILTKVKLDKNHNGKWRLPGNLLGMSLQYRLRVYDKHGRYDDTQMQQVDFRPRFAVEAEKVDGYLMTAYGESQIAQKNIKLNGGMLTLYGEQVPDRHNVYFLGRTVAITRERKFVHQQIVHTGFHRAEVAVLDGDGNGHLIHRDLELPESDWFYVAMADLTLGQNSHNGPVELLSSDHNKDGNLFATGRLAGYITGKWRDEYKVTARIDTQEQPVNKLLSGLHEKDPNSLFRRLEEEQHPAEYGDDSVVQDDAPSNGKVYLKIAKDDSHVMWGNFFTKIQDTELARVERGLYGLQTQYQSEAKTSFMDASTQAQVFVAQAETMPAFESHRATGGSLYYLQHQDIVRGSEQLAIEVRDKTSGLVLVRRSLMAGQDYDIDALQGRVILNRPLSSFEQDDLVVRAAAMDANPVFLTAQYEFTPGFDELDNLSYGARVSHWLTEQVKVGATLSEQQLDSHDDSLYALDATYRLSEHSYVKVEVAQSEGIGETLNSFNGGMNFNPVQSGMLPVKANAQRIEAAFSLADLFTQNNDEAEEASRLQFYWQKMQAGFSGVGQTSRTDTTLAGIKGEFELSDDTQLIVKADQNKQQALEQRQAVEVNVAHQVSDNWQATAGIRHDDREPLQVLANSTPSPLNLDQGARTDAVVQLDYQGTTDWQAYGFVQATLNSESSRLRNNRVGLGGEIQLTEKLALNGEISDGNLGLAGKVGVSYDYAPESNIYVDFSDDPDGGIITQGKQKNWVTGAKHRFNDSTSMYAEQLWQSQAQQQGLTHAYGIDHQINSRWLVGVNFETGELESDTSKVQRDGTGLSISYTSPIFQWRSAIEYREDQDSTQTRTSWLTRQNLRANLNENWRAQLRFDWAKSDSSQQAEVGALNSDFTEAQFGVAYRPLKASPWSGLASVTYLEDLAPAGQLNGIGLDNTPQQRSRVWAVDVNYQLTPKWRFGTKLAERHGEMRMRDGNSPWFDSTASLQVFRADYHLQHNWDATLEWRRLAVDLAQDQREGALISIHRHIGEHMKLGVGYNFTDFSDDLTDLDYDSKGWFINIVGKF